MPNTSSFHYIDLKHDDCVALITLKRPDSLNAITWDMATELHDALDEVSNEFPAIRVVIITGEGRGFCSGADVGDMSARLQQSQSGSMNNVDHGPSVTVAAALQAVGNGGVVVALVGDPSAIQIELDKYDTPAKQLIQVVPADGVVEEGESPARAFRSKPKASVFVAYQLAMSPSCASCGVLHIFPIYECVWWCSPRALLGEAQTISLRQYPKGYFFLSLYIFGELP